MKLKIFVGLLSLLFIAQFVAAQVVDTTGIGSLDFTTIDAAKAAGLLVDGARDFDRAG